MSARRPAYSSAFAPEAIRPLPRNAFLDVLTPDDAWGGSTGKGVKGLVASNGALSAWASQASHAARSSPNSSGTGAQNTCAVIDL